VNVLELLSDKRVLVCVGSGGVGKTTTSAALALQAALAGKRTLVLTIDPARRLANALGLQEFGNEATPVDIGPASGSLAAMMLDMKRTFDDMVTEYMPDPAARERLHGNRLYRSMSEALAGVQEYMAVSKLYDVLALGQYDLVVLDTPPTAHALDFLDAPRRFTDFLDNDALQWILKSGLVAGRVGFRLFDLGLGYIVKTLGRVAGIDVLRDIAEFVAAFEPLFHGFRARAEKVNTLLRSPALGFLIITAPTHTQIDEALFFERKLRGEHLTLLASVVNRLHLPLPASELDPARIATVLPDPALAAAARDAGERYNAMAANEAQEMARLTGRVLFAEELREDVHDLAGLRRLGDELRER
jgi:anion-transporting  ArsA/GET3 family ATPase